MTPEEALQAFNLLKERADQANQLATSLRSIEAQVRDLQSKLFCAERKVKSAEHDRTNLIRQIAEAASITDYDGDPEEDLEKVLEAIKSIVDGAEEDAEKVFTLTKERNLAIARYDALVSALRAANLGAVVDRSGQ